MILGTTRAVRAFAYPQPTDLRKGYNGLFGLVKTGLGRDPMSGELFLFVNKRRHPTTFCIRFAICPRPLSLASAPRRASRSSAHDRSG